MLGFRKKAEGHTPELVGGWDAAQYRWLLGYLAGRDAMVQMILTGYEETIVLEGGHARSAHRVVGTLGYPAAKVIGNIDALSSEDGSLGRISFTALDKDTRKSVVPVVQLHLSVPDQGQLTALRDGLRGSLGRAGTAWLNLRVAQVTDVDGEFQQMMEKGYSCSVAVRAIYFGSAVGQLCD